jgi:hypothetical protein
MSGREWLVIESAWGNAVFAGAPKPPGYIPRDAAEKLLGRDLGGRVWFTKEESERMREHEEWRDSMPPSKEEREAAKERAYNAMALAEQIRRMLAGLGPEVQGAVLADLTAIWLAGHAKELRPEIVRLHYEAIAKLVVVEDIVCEEGA